MEGWNWNGRSSKAVVQNESLDYVKEKVQVYKSKGFVPLMEIKEEVDFMGRGYFVCVLENPKLKELNELKRMKAKTPH